VSPPAGSLGPKVRPAGPADLDGLLAVEAIFPTDRLDRRAFRRALRAATIDMLVAEDQGAIVGYAMAHRRRDSDVARLTSIAIIPRMAGRGIGRQLLASMEETARRHGAARLRLEVRADNIPAQKLYDRAGYRRFATVEGYYEDGEAAWRYEKTLV
jgi:[ribosomal protein S18]-alanine N-acetyltransferase